MDQVEKKERMLKQRIELLEKENHLLKKSLFDLSLKLNQKGSQSAEKFPEELPEFDTAQPNQSKKLFHEKGELQGHQGAIYCLKFSPNGKFIATGSFDKTVRVWDWKTQMQTECLSEHDLNISDLGWSYDSNFLVSGAYDQTCKVWDIQAGKSVDTLEADGFIQCVSFSPLDLNIFFYGTSRNNFGLKDLRQPSPIVFKNDTMVNAISVYQDGLNLMTGDAAGLLKTWDIKAGKVIDVQKDSVNSPISCISTCNVPEEEARLFATNSYDNVIRIYDRGIIQPFRHTCIHQIKGVKNKNWPIKSAFYKTESLRASSEDLYNTEEKDHGYALLASGSAESSFYVWSVGLQPVPNFYKGKVDSIQRIEGHSDRVYTCDFHPRDLLLASGSADFSVRLWAMNPRKRNFS